jgi:hypothetical protein
MLVTFSKLFPFQLSSHPWAFDLVVCRLKLSFTNVFIIFISLKYRNNRLITIYVHDMILLY